jgi:hypothetical protein
MKAQRKTAKAFRASPSFEFCYQRPKNSLRVECDSLGRVTIRAAHANFSPSDKRCFVHYLADEGFISERFRSYHLEHDEPWPGLEWLVEKRSYTLGSAGSGSNGQPRAFMIRLLVYSSLLWALEMILLFLKS